MKRLLAMALLLGSAAGAWAQATPVGLWKTIDDETGKPKSLVRITEAGGTLSGRIERLIDPDKPDPRCDKCTDARKGQPVLGMTIIEGAKKEADEPYWAGGTILDPNNGKTYRLRLTPEDGGKALQVRGYIGPFYRNQTWLRVE
ncbi:MAG: DUF2147 domain-containing protein [Burkholderiales bacterium]|nr:DUF2147 domain-containing protein [Burkholderiales bacterium]